jgi:hypothetical protein
MRAKLGEKVEGGRLNYSSPEDGANGAFLITAPNGVTLKIIATDGTDPAALGWEHVSVSPSGPKRCPNWPEMCFVKDLFWDDEEGVVQFHPPKSRYVNHHPFTLHLWRRRDDKGETPPWWLVGPKD